MVLDKNEMLRMIGEIDKQLNDNERIYRGLQLKPMSELTQRELESLNRLGELSVWLMVTRNNICETLRKDHGIFVF